jgi:chromosome segregation ATPase
MKKRAIIREVEDLRRRVNGIGTKAEGNDLRHEIRMKLSEIGNLDTAIRRLTERMAEVDDVASKLAWLHERVDLLATRLENMRGNVTLDDAAAKRLTYQVGQFAARLDRLEAPTARPDAISRVPPAPYRATEHPAGTPPPEKAKRAVRRAAAPENADP